jgi:hypothetical protein
MLSRVIEHCTVKVSEHTGPMSGQVVTYTDVSIHTSQIGPDLGLCPVVTEQTRLIMKNPLWTLSSDLTCGGSASSE